MTTAILLVFAVTACDQRSVLNAYFTAKLDLNTWKVYYINKILILYLIITKNFIYILISITSFFFNFTVDLLNVVI